MSPNDEEAISVSVTLKLTLEILDKIDTTSKEWGTSRSEVINKILRSIFTDEDEIES